MRLGILTLPLHTNYGGIMQAYALQKILIRMGHEVVLVNLPLAKHSFIFRIKEFLKRVVKRFLLFKPVSLNAFPSLKERKNISKHITPFIDRYLNIINCVESDLLNLTISEKLDGYIVGSDQVWRPAYSSFVACFFLSFLGDIKIKKISYAASLGVDYWPFTENETCLFANMLKKFDAISVREDSAVSLCMSYWGIVPELVLDPTLLLDKQDYIDLCDLLPNCDDKKLMVYILDINTDKNKIINRVAESLGLSVNFVMPKAKYWNVGSLGIEDCIIPPISDWILGFKNASFVVTDSFHGMVFSILFAKPFICIGNKTRGITRFTSLLKLYKLEDRLIYSLADFDINIVNKNIDYKLVDSIRKNEINKSLLFLSNAINS